MANYSKALCFRFGVCGIVLLAYMGCSDNLATYPVTGKVEFADGTPAMFGEIELQSLSHPINARGKINRSGEFSLTTYQDGDGAVGGEHKIVITQLIPPTPLGVQVNHDHGDSIHSKYFSYKTSGLTTTVEQKKNKIVLVVEKSEDP